MVMRSFSLTLQRRSSSSLTSSDSCTAKERSVTYTFSGRGQIRLSAQRCSRARHAHGRHDDVSDLLRRLPTHLGEARLDVGDLLPIRLDLLHPAGQQRSIVSAVLCSAVARVQFSKVHYLEAVTKEHKGSGSMLRLTENLSSLSLRIYCLSPCQQDCLNEHASVMQRMRWRW